MNMYNPSWIYQIVIINLNQAEHCIKNIYILPTKLLLHNYPYRSMKLVQVNVSILLFWGLILGCSQDSARVTSGSEISNPEFISILSDSTLENWEGNPTYWRFEDSVLIGEITPETILIENTFFVWKKETTGDFELKMDYRISERGNSGINYRSQRIEDKPYVLSGYQADIDGANTFTGQIFEEKGRNLLSARGQLSYISYSNEVSVVSQIDTNANLLEYINDDWNEYHIILRDNLLVQSINGQIMSMALDNGANAKSKGLIGFQLHLGPPMKVEFKNVQYKELSK